jgi:hypothetical protein
MLDRRGKDLPRFAQAAAGGQLAIDLCAILGPLLGLVEVARVRN